MEGPVSEGLVMYRFLRSPRWVVGHVLVLVTVVTFVNLGMWQLGRLEERRSHNALLSDRMAQPAIDLAAAAADPDATAYRVVTASGTYLHEHEVLLSTRSHSGQPGHHVLTPLRADDGTTVVIDRGWVPLDWDDPPVEQAAPPPGQVTVEGLLFPGSSARRSGALDGRGGELQFVSDVDLGVLEDATGLDLHPLYVLAREQQPPQAEFPRVAAARALTEGSHLSYAMQWFLFAGVVLVGYPLLLRRTARDERERGDPGDPGDPAPEREDVPSPVA